MKTRVFVLTLFVSSCLGAALFAGEQKRYAIVGENLPAVEQEVQAQGGKKIHNFRCLKGFAAYLSEAQAEKLQKKFGAKIRVREDEWIQVLQGKPQKPGKPAYGQSIEWGISAVKAPEAWAINKGANINVAVVDTGIDKDHPDLAANILGGKNVMPDKKGSVDPDAYDDDNNHGSHVAGIVAALDNNIGVVGVAPEAKIIAIKAIDNRGRSTMAILTDGVLAAHTNFNCQVINMSWRVPIGDQTFLKEAITDAYNNGVILVAASGNNQYHSPYSTAPASYPEVISVGAVDSDLAIPYWSCGGADYVAPGVDVRSANKSGGYTTMDGTSMASPHVAGVVALKLSSGSLGLIADDLGLDPTWQGSGLINALSTVQNQNTALNRLRSSPSAREPRALAAHAGAVGVEQLLDALHQHGRRYPDGQAILLTPLP